MSGFYLTLLAVLLSGIGARDQVTVAQMAQAQGQRPMALVIGVAVSMGSAAFAAWAASQVAPLLVPRARLVLAAMALALAGAESLLFAPGRKPAEPTASLFALGVVLLARQVTDAARFLVFAVAVATNAPLAAGLAGAVAGPVLLATGWSAPELVLRPAARWLRRALGLMLVLVGGYVALHAFGKI